MSNNSHPHKSTTHREQFIHVKEPLTLEGRNYKGGTVFFRWTGDSVLCSVSRCSETDNWCRTYGRNVARRRYFLGYYSIVGIPANETPTYKMARAAYRNEAWG